MNKRDKSILADLNRFRCLSRDDIVDLHFQGLKNPITCCNTVLKRLRRDGHVEANTQQQPYVYFPSPSPIKRNSQKIPHFLAIADVYKQLLQYEKPKQFIVEPKYGKEYMEPDIFILWRKAPFFIEVQRSLYGEKVMRAKLERYENYFRSGEWKEEPWQPQQKKVFPVLLILTDTRYAISSRSFRIFQAQNIKEFVELANNVEHKSKPQPLQERISVPVPHQQERVMIKGSEGIKIKL